MYDNYLQFIEYILGDIKHYEHYYMNIRDLYKLAENLALFFPLTPPNQRW